MKVQYKYSEWLYPIFYHENPVPNLYVRNRTKSEIMSQFTHGVDYLHDDEAGFEKINKVYPEGDIFA